MNARRNYSELKNKKENEEKTQQNPAMKEAGKFFLDIAKLIIGGVILTSVMKQKLHLFPTITLD